MNPESPDPADPLLDEIRDLRQSVWAQAAPPASERETQQRLLLDKMRTLSVELVQRGITTALIEGAYLVWWLRLACINHRFAEGGFERCLGRIGPLMGPVSDIMNRLGHEIQDDGPPPEMKRLGDKLEQVRGLLGGSAASWPASREDGHAQTEMAHSCIQRTLLEAIDAGIPADLIESMLLYLWFRCTANRRGLKEAFFQKLERHWDLVMEQVNRYMDDQAAADRRQE